MSGIFRRNRTETGLEFWDTAVEIKREVTRFLMNPNNVPKSYRFVFTFRIIGLTFDLRDAITRANTTFPVNEHELQRRKDFQQDAINTNEAIVQNLQDMLDVLTGIDADKLDHIGDLLIRESALLRAWRKSSKLMKR